MHIDDATILASLIYCPEVRYTISLIDPRGLIGQEAREIFNCINKHIDASAEEMLMHIARETSIKDFKWMDYGVFNEEMAARIIRDYYHESLRVKLGNQLTDIAKRLVARNISVQDALDEAWAFQEKLITQNEAKDLKKIAQFRINQRGI